MPTPRTANELRRAFVSFFERHGHTHVPSSSLIPHDPTVLFTVAGMVQFKPFFLGDEIAPYSRAVTVQKCARAGGKHNDLDDVGRTARHLVFFEMLGNFSFGDYFKADAIPWAWDFVTGDLGLDPERLWVTVHLSDDEAAEIWRDAVGVPAHKIQRLDEDNFWRMGETGPCGPCSEIFWDKGPAYGHEGGPEHGSDERYVEIWNLVFMQFNQTVDGMDPLPKPSIDTGAGLERILGVLQGVDSVWETDALAPLIESASSLTGVGHGADRKSDVSLRIVAEHARSGSMLVNDGVFPSNEGRGYVLRRILRRAIRHAWLLGAKQPVMPRMVGTVIDVMGEAYPDLARNRDFVTGVMAKEEERFRRTLETGMGILEDEIAGLAGRTTFAGTTAFKLHDTYGFPLELTQEITAERGIGVDKAGFDAEMAEQRRRAKDARKGGGDDPDRLDAYREVLEQFGTTEFTGYATDAGEGRVLAVLPAGGPEAEGLVEVFCDRTPFYAESGGQVGDTGTLTTDTGELEVLDTTFALPGLRRHTARVTHGEVTPGQHAHLAVDADRRARIRRNHTGTHLLHWALREVLGPHVKQAGSLVAPDRLRFDFSHYAAVTPDELRRIEDLANAEVLANTAVTATEMAKADAEALGAIAFFGDKYGETVRVLRAGDHSLEFCGGTHVRALGDIGTIRIVGEGSIGSNLRRIEALTGTGTIERMRAAEDVLARAAALVGTTPEGVVEGIERRLDEAKRLRDELKALRQKAAGDRAAELAATAVDGVVVARVDGTSRDDVRDLAVAVRGRDGVRAVVLGGVPDGGGVALVAAVRPGSGLHAGELIGPSARLVGGGAGKAPEVAVAGGKDPSKLDEALDLVRRSLTPAP